MQTTTIKGDQDLQCLAEVFRIVTEEYKQKPIVVDADDLQKNPGMSSHFGEISQGAPHAELDNLGLASMNRWLTVMFVQRLRAVISK